MDASEIHSYVETLEEEEIMDEYEVTPPPPLLSIIYTVIVTLLCTQDIVAMDVQFYNFTAGLKSNKNKNRYVDILASEC